MPKSYSRLIHTSDPEQPLAPHHKISGKGAPIRIFKHDWMESFTLISFKVFFISCFLCESLALTTTFIYSHYFLHSLTYFVIALPIWIITEYILHRYIFHFVSDNKKIQHLVYVFHGNHHIQPSHPHRTLMPLIVTLPIGAVIWAVSIWCAGVGSGSAFFSGFFLGYALYDTLHFATHNFSMKRFPFSWWKRHHLLHHYMTEEHNYSITMPWLDRLLRTHYCPARNAKKKRAHSPSHKEHS